MRRHCTGSKLAGNGSYPDIQVAARLNALDIGGTVDYHNSLLDQARHQHEFEQPSKPHAYRGHQGASHSLGSLRQWLGTTVHGNNAIKRRTKNEKDQQNFELALPPHPHLTRKEIEEFEALPLAIRRKYFSTLERLRLAQTCGVLEPSNHADKGLRRHHHQRRGASLGTAVVPSKLLERPITSPTCQDNVLPIDCAFLAKLPAKIREKHLTREEQVLVARQLRQSVILDAADEAFLKAGRLANRRPSPPPLSPPTLSSSGRPSMESLLSDNASAGKHDSLYDSFRWLDEDEDLDLRLALDDYHINLKESVPTPPKDSRPPPVRRHLSFSKIPFGRTSLSMSRPATKDAPPPTANSASPSLMGYSQTGRRKSKALSLIAPKHSTHESISSIDPGAAHYQDPEARLKLRVYLASPQKFDEAIEFGFPSNDSSAGPYGNFPSSAKGQSHCIFSPDSEKFKTFLADDQSSTYSEDVSLPDPESPRTPSTMDKHEKPPLQSHADEFPTRFPEGYAQVPAASREMTLRMTLTRPDLRACEDQIYGWQQNTSRQYSSKPAQILALRDDLPPPAPYARDGPKESMDKIFADIDHELGLPAPTDNNVVKRIWNRVRRG